MSEQMPAASKFVMLSIFGVAMLVLYRVAVHAKGVADITWFLKIVVVQIVIYVAATWLALRTKDSRSLLIIGLVFAALFRLSIILFPPYLSDDIYRYVWDGRVQAAGVNPYRYIPSDKSLADLRDEKILPEYQQTRLRAHDVPTRRGRCISFDHSR
jgi:hypothetical protein